jgi:hypothetical protein
MDTSMAGTVESMLGNDAGESSLVTDVYFLGRDLENTPLTRDRHMRGYRHGARDGFVGEGRRARDVGYEDGWWGGDRHGMEEAYDDYFGNFDPRVPTGYEYDYGVLNMMDPYGYDDRGYGYGDMGYGYGGMYDDGFY